MMQPQSVGTRSIRNRRLARPDSYLGIHRFLDYLSCALHTTVNVRNRVVVFSGGCDSFVKGTTWKEFDLEAAKHKNVWLWTKEMMEPTISALVSVFRSPKQRNES